MGCCQYERPLGSEIIPEKEKPFTQAESQFPFSKLPVRTVCAELLANDRDRCIPLRNFQRMCEHFNIPISKVLENSEFADSVMATPSHFLTEQLLLCCLILCKGTAYQKTCIWFDYYDREAMGQLDLNQFKRMLKSLLHVATDILPLLAIDKVGQTAIDSYIQELNATKKPFVARYLNSVNKVIPIEIMKTVQQDKSLLFSNPRLLLLKEQKTQGEMIDSPISTHGQDSQSESEQSDDSIVIQVRLSTNEQQSVVLHPDDDPFDVVENFSVRNSLSSEEKIKLLETIHHIQNNLVNS